MEFAFKISLVFRDSLSALL